MATSLTSGVPADRAELPGGLRLEDLLRREWIVADGAGGYASSTPLLCPTRRQHGLLVAPPPGAEKRHVFLARFEESVHGAEHSFPLSLARYPNSWAPLGHRGFAGFALHPWPTCTHRIGRAEIVREYLPVHGRHAVLCRWTVRSMVWPLTLKLRPLLAYREADSLTFENPALDPRTQRTKLGLSFRPYSELPALHFSCTGGNSAFHADPLWYRKIQYLRDLERGYAAEEDQFSPGTFELSLAQEGSVLIAAALDAPIEDLEACWERESARRNATQPAAPDGVCASLAATADEFLYRAPDGRLGVIAGFPWFGEWGRDTMIALPGLTLARDRVAECEEVLRGVLRHRRGGLLPNVFNAEGAAVDWGSADAALWLARAVRLWERAAGASANAVMQEEFGPALRAIAESYLDGGELGMRVDEHGLLLAGSPEHNATWMDARVQGVPVTPRNGAAVELCALWYFLLTQLERLALEGGNRREARRWMEHRRRAQRGFLEKLWMPAERRLADVWNPQTGVDDSLRPNMVIAAALEFSPLSRGKRTDVMRHAGKFLLTPCGLRTLSPDDPAYCPRYAGTPDARDGAYHQGTVWPWLMGFYVEAHLRAFGNAPANLERLRELVEGFGAQLEQAGLGHVSEVFDGDPPHRPGGTIAQAWNSGELLRALRMIEDGQA
ncbi:MAG: glycogen debranching enzyme N-terminal domain-containing protein [Planctomycetota bacterium]|nr:glycogen debranching enzyme N-terminal domain-containing protein [Planctomycetota bacterium]